MSLVKRLKNLCTLFGEAAKTPNKQESRQGFFDAPPPVFAIEHAATSRMLDKRRLDRQTPTQPNQMTDTSQSSSPIATTHTTDNGLLAFGAALYVAGLSTTHETCNTPSESRGGGDSGSSSSNDSGGVSCDI